MGLAQRSPPEFPMIFPACPRSPRAPGDLEPQIWGPTAAAIPWLVPAVVTKKSSRTALSAGEEPRGSQASVQLQLRLHGEPESQAQKTRTEGHGISAAGSQPGPGLLSAPVCLPARRQEQPWGRGGVQAQRRGSSLTQLWSSHSTRQGSRGSWDVHGCPWSAPKTASPGPDGSGANSARHSES